MPTQKEIDIFFHGAEMGHIDLITEFLDRHGAAAIDQRDSAGMTALMYASGYEDLAIIELLLTRGASIDATDKNGFTALIHAAWAGHMDTVKLLLEKGASIEEKGADGKTALMWAQADGRTDMAALIGRYSEIKKEKAHVCTIAQTETRLDQIKQLPKPILKKGR